MPTDEKTAEKRTLPTSCEYCGTENAQHKCSRCESTYYCSRECQVDAWKNLNHKKECPTLKKACADGADALIKSFGDTSLTPGQRVEHLESLSREGCYHEAIRKGLHSKMVDLFVEEEGAIKERYLEKKICMSWVHFVTCALFRGQRCCVKEGVPRFARADCSRVVAFVLSDARAWESWFQTCLKMAELVREPVKDYHRLT